MTQFSRGRFAQFISDRSGLAFPYTEMVVEWTGARVHTSEFEPKSAQVSPRPHGADPQALPFARPARTEFATEDFLPGNPFTTGAGGSLLGLIIDFPNGNLQVNDFVRLRNVKEPVGGVAVSTLQMSTTLNGAITDSATTINLTDGSEFPITGFIVIEKVLTASDTSDPLLVGTFQNEVIEYTGRSSNQLTGCSRGTSAPYRGASPEKTIVGSHVNGAKVFGSYKVASLNTTQVKGTGQPEFSTQFDGVDVTLTNAFSSVETGGGFQCTIGPINDRG